MKILLIGAQGQLGSDLVNCLEDHTLISLAHKDLDITDKEACKKIVEVHKPAIVINTAAFHVVDACEEEIKKSFLVNAIALKHLCLFCNENKSTLVHFSTDYVFDGKKKQPYAEEDMPNPLSVYAMSKLAGELMIKRYCTNYFLIRTSGLYGVAGSSGKGGNFVETMIRLAKEDKDLRVVNDQILTPTSTKVLALKIKGLIQTKKFGLYHITNNGQCSWYEFAQKIFEYLSMKPKLSSITTQEFGAKALRPSYSVLAHNHLKDVGLDDLPYWSISLKEYLQEKGYLH